MGRLTREAELPALTHAEVMRRLAREVELIGSKALAARVFGISPQLLSFAMTGQRSIGPKLQRALKVRRVRLVVYRYEPLPTKAVRA